MRVPIVLCLVFVLSGCSALAQISLGGPPKLDPNKVYLGTSRVILSGNELERYACVNGALVCESFAASFDCRCPDPY